jgi:uncharacterized protein (DUF924 family)
LSHEAVLKFWFDELTPKQHWTKDPELDARIRERFSAIYEEIAAGDREGWLDAPRTCLAYVIVLDQFSRNMFRDTPRMYAADERAQRAVEHALVRGYDAELSDQERGFLFMPLMHSESLAHQDRCVALYKGHKNEKFAHMHRDIVARWGRFPHRNAILGRESTPEEAEFLNQPGSSF